MPQNRRRIEVLPYDPQWAAAFREEANLLRSVFGDEVLAINHIGSTSVPGLPAKTIIDIALEVRDIEKVGLYNDQMRALGYEPRGEYGLPRRRFFPKTVDGRRTSHVHTWQAGDPEIERHLSFRDYLIAHPESRKTYGDLKIGLAKSFADDQESYIHGKNDFIKETERRALAWTRAIQDQVVKTERLTLLPLNPAQLGQYLNHLSQLESALHLDLSRGVLADPVPRAIRSKIRSTSGASLEQILWNTYWLVIIDDDNFGAGLIGFKGVPQPDGTVEIGYGIDAHVRRQGYTTEAVRALVGWALAVPECQAVTAQTEKDNIASIRVLEKLGFSMARETDDELCWIVAGRSGGLNPEIGGK